jgi:uncharacterized protein (DUF924 family)
MKKDTDALSTEIVDFWKKAGPDKWFDKDAAFDSHFHDRFRDAHFAAARRELDDWLESAESSLALMLLLDQFPRNCFRDTAHMYATDPLARLFADEAIRRGHDQAVGEDLRVFFYLPFSHAEDLRDQERACTLNQPLGGLYLHHAEEHRDIVKRFGRVPPRHHLFLRETTPEERQNLEEGGFFG